MNLEKGSVLSYLGKEYVLQVKHYLSYRKPGVLLEENKIVVLTANIDKNVIEKAVREWFLERARVMIYSRLKYYGKIVNESYENVRIKDVKSCWGSCSSKRNLNFNWRLIMTPMDVLDYVVVHELCHLKEMNHSKEFWKLVEEVLPDYKKQREWLKECKLIEMY